MKLIKSNELKDYRQVATLPSFSVWEHPTTFHTYILHHRRSKTPENFLVVGEGVWPGLGNDAPVTIPAGMWREVVRGLQGTSSPPRVRRDYVVEAPPQHRVDEPPQANLQQLGDIYNQPYAWYVAEPPAPPAAPPRARVMVDRVERLAVRNREE